MIRKVKVMLPTIIAAHFLSQMGEKVEKAFYSPSVYQKQSIHDTDMLVHLKRKNKPEISRDRAKQLKFEFKLNKSNHIEGKVRSD